MIEQFFSKHIAQIMLLVIMYGMVVACVFLDLWSGVRKAKKAGKFDGSFGIRKTVEKLLRYLNLLLVLTAVDVMIMVAIGTINAQAERSWLIMPFLSIIGAIFLGAVEVYSVYESAEKKEKARMRETAKIIAALVESNTDMAEKILSVVRSAKSEVPSAPNEEHVNYQQ